MGCEGRNGKRAETMPRQGVSPIHLDRQMTIWEVEMDRVGG